MYFSFVFIQIILFSSRNQYIKKIKPYVLKNKEPFPFKGQS